MTKPYRAEQPTAKRRLVYEPEEVRRVLACCPDSPSGMRDRVAVMLMWCAGLRPSELVALTPTDFGPDGSSVLAGDREVIVPGAERQRLAEYLSAWLRHRADVADLESPMLCNLSGGALDRSYLRHALAQLARAAKLTKPLTAQGLRNTFAAAMHRKRVPMELIRRQLGLSDLEYTAAYLAGICPLEQQDAMADFDLE